MLVIVTRGLRFFWNVTPANSEGKLYLSYANKHPNINTVTRTYICTTLFPLFSKLSNQCPNVLKLHSGFVIWNCYQKYICRSKNNSFNNQSWSVIQQSLETNQVKCLLWDFWVSKSEMVYFHIENLNAKVGYTLFFITFETLQNFSCWLKLKFNYLGL
jgi:hypothetical protein